MKKLIYVFLLIILASCGSQDKYSDFDYSYSRSGGFAPIYENLLIKGNKVHYSFEGHQKNIKKDFTISNDDLKNIERVLTENNFRMIREDYKKVYDNITTSINVKKGNNSGSKSDASFIMENDLPRWNKIVVVFQQIIDQNTTTKSGK
ncbi:hypothetical protein FNJ88_10790 [Chryseobacterium sp. SNU WT5]|uniref:hypothetical protein n=1 Tax=Chryseobacterium sp. SNU WT5 TaxID=2594269 RepID=UPI0011810FC1|nr:hypothetical protein [Chryseobacterium sp. SNU WT5]QDP86008.1 hypothetical protein FNJ88_10790 [Chryseobacterium sp. SNU WT5]